MIILKRFILLLSFLYMTGCATVGPLVSIETPEPADDFVVVCQWYKQPLFAVHSSSQLSSEDSYVSSSGETISCGLGLGHGTQVKILHPIYTDPEIVDSEGTLVYRYTKTRLDVLDEQKVKFEAGYWDKHRSPNTAYARSFGSCGFGYMYFEHYGKADKIDKNYFYQKYNSFLFECNKKIYEEVLKHDPAIAERSFNVDKTMNRIWASDKWEAYEN